MYPTDTVSYHFEARDGMNFMSLWAKTTPAELGVTLMLACLAQMFVGKSKRRNSHSHTQSHPHTTCTFTSEYYITMT